MNYYEVTLASGRRVYICDADPHFAVIKELIDALAAACAERDGLRDASEVGAA